MMLLLLHFCQSPHRYVRDRNIYIYTWFVMTAQKQYWNSASALFSPTALESVARNFRKTTFVVRDQQTGAIGCCFDGESSSSNQSDELLTTLPPLYPEWLGDRRFTHRHNLRYGYVAGAMANGIASEELVVAMVQSCTEDKLSITQTAAQISPRAPGQ